MEPIQLEISFHQPRRRRKRLLIFIMVVTLFANCQWETPGARYIGLYGVSNELISAFGLNVLIVGVHTRLGGTTGIGLYGTGLFGLLGAPRWMPHVHISILPFLGTRIGIDLLIISIGIGPN